MFSLTIDKHVCVEDSSAEALVFLNKIRFIELLLDCLFPLQDASTPHQLVLVFILTYINRCWSLKGAVCKRSR